MSDRDFAQRFDGLVNGFGALRAVAHAQAVALRDTCRQAGSTSAKAMDVGVMNRSTVHDEFRCFMCAS